MKCPKSFEWIQPGAGCTYKGHGHVIVSYPIWHAASEGWYVDYIYTHQIGY